MSIRIDNVADYLLRTANIPAASPVTIMGWIYLVNDRNSDGIIFQIVNGDGSQWENVRFPTDGTTPEISTQNGLTSSGVSLSTGTWYHLAYSRNGAAHNLYIDAGTPTARSDNNTLTTPTYLIAGGNTFDWCDARFADLRIYTAELAQAEIVIERRSPVAVRTSNLYGDYQTPSGATRVNDSSANAYHWTAGGTLTDEADPPYTFNFTATDSAALSESAQISVSVPVVDSATLTDASSVTEGTVFKTATDSATLNDGTTTIDTIGAMTDYATLTEAALVSVPITAIDDAALSETVSVAITIAVVDIGTLSEATVTTATLIGSDSATLTDIGSLSASNPTTDTGTLIEAGNLTALNAGIDSAELTEALSVSAVLAGVDSSALSEAVSSSAIIGGTDDFTFSEACLVSEEGNSSATDSFSLSEICTITSGFGVSDDAILSESSALNTGTNPSGTDGAILYELASLLALGMANDDDASISMMLHRRINW